MPRRRLPQDIDRPVRYKGVTIRIPLGLDAEGEAAYIAEVIDPLMQEPEYLDRKARTAVQRIYHDEMVAKLKTNGEERRRNGGPTDAELEAAAAGSEQRKQDLFRQYPGLKPEASAKIATAQARD